MTIPLRNPNPPNPINLNPGVVSSQSAISNRASILQAARQHIANGASAATVATQLAATYSEHFATAAYARQAIEEAALPPLNP